MSKVIHDLLAEITLLLMGLFVAIAALSAPHIASADPVILYAAPTALGVGDCSSWANACSLQTALAQAQSGDEIWVQAGVHYPGATGNLNAAFALKSGVAIYGGFNGTETSRDQRNWQNNLTILSGDLDQNDINTDGNFIAETWQDIQGDNAYHVVVGNGANNSAVLDGFVITAGYANGSYPHRFGGGMYNANSSPTLTRLIFIGNRSYGAGGGMFNEGASSPLLVEVAFSGNLAGASGGGAANTEGATPVFNKVVFNGNTSNMFGGGMLIIGSPTLVNVEFKGNQAQSGGGGVFTYRGSTPTLTNVIFSNNTALADGGGMLNNGNPTLTNVTFSGNVAAGNGGGMYNNAVNPNLRNVIIWGNTAGNSQASIYNYGGSAPLITYSDIQGCGGSGSWQGWCGTDGGGNIDADPLFLDATNGDLRLQLTSPAIDAGNNIAVPPGVITDLDDNPRFVDIPTMPDSGNGAPPIVDMGAYEVQDTIPPTVLSITRTDPNPTSAASVNYTVTFSEPVTGVDTGDFDLAITGGISGVSVSGVSGAGVTYIVTVETGSGDGYLGLVIGGTADVRDQAGNRLIGLPFTSGESYTVDKTPPTLVSIVRADPDPTNAADVRFTVTFSEVVTDVEITDFSLVIVGDITDASVSGVVGSGAVYTVTTSTGNGDGMLRLDVPTTAVITDAVGHLLAGLPYADGQSYTIDKTPPRVLSILRADPNPTEAESVRFIATFSENVFDVDTADFTANVISGAINGVSVIGVSGSGMTYTATVDTGAGIGMLRLDVPVTATTFDLAGNPLDDLPYVSGEVYTIDRVPVFYAAPVAVGSGDCSSWENACTLQTALGRVPAIAEIWVKEGVHYPGAPGNRSATFTLKNGVALYGGFNGTEYHRDRRDWQANLTILSGDIDQNDTNADGNLIAETWNDIQGENAYHVVTGGWTDSTAVLDGFIITAGQANGSSIHNYGGGMYNSGSNPSLSNIILTGNIAAQLGGGMYNNYSSPSLSGVTFSGNSAAFGGGMYNNTLSPTLTAVNFSGNSGTQRGGGMYNVSGNPLLTDVTFLGNSARYGGGLYNDYGSPTLNHVAFYGNSVVGAHGSIGADGGGTGGPGENSYGGGLYNDSGTLAITGSLFDNNSARGGQGGAGDASMATYCYRDFWSGWICTYGHQAGNGGVGGNSYGGAIYNASGVLTVTGTRFQGNRAYGGQGGAGGAGSPSYSGSGWYYSGFSGGSGGSGGWGYGGAVYNGGTAYLTNVSFLQNEGSGGNGGNAGSNAGNGTRMGGTGGFGYGGAVDNNGGSAFATNIAMWRNRVIGGYGGWGIPSGNYGNGFGGGMSNSGAALIVNGTVVRNSVFNYGLGGGVYKNSGTLTFKNTIVAQNSQYDCYGGVTSEGHNLDGGVSCGFAQAGDLSYTDPLFVDATNGDLRLQLTSPAVDAGNNTAVPFGIITDLGDNPRFVDVPTAPDTGNGTSPIVDMGAYESQYVDVKLNKAVSPLTAVPGETITFTLALTNTGSLPASGLVVTDTLPVFLLGETFTSTLVVTDTGNTPPYVWTVQELAPGESGVITVSGVLAVPLAAGTYTNTAVITAENDLLAENNESAIAYAVVNVAPAFTSTPITAATRDVPYTYNITAADDNGDALIITATTLPTWLTLVDHGDGTATLSGTPTEADAGEHEVVLRVMDPGGLYLEQLFTIRVVAPLYLPLVVRSAP